MKKSLLVILLLQLVYFVSVLPAQERIVQTLKDGWKFAKGDHKSAININFDDSNWEVVTVPHDWAISGPFDEKGDPETGKLPWQGEGWYRRTFIIDKELEGKQIYFVFDGIMAFPIIYLNGKLAGEWDYGYNSFYINATKLLKFGGENILTIHADTREHDSRWYPGAGIFRKIEMIATSALHVEIWGTYVTTPAVEQKWSDVRTVTTIANNFNESKKFELETSIVGPENGIVKSHKSNIEIEAQESIEVENWFTLSNPQKWDIDSPTLYRFKTDIILDGQVIDSYSTPFGIRKFKFTEDDGFFLNDRRVQFKGVNLHHDLGPLGAAFNKSAMRRQLEIMKEIGCNAIRTSHNIPAPELLDLCDEMGLLVIDEIYDKWDRKGGFIPGNDFFESAERNMRNFIKRDRNHPSIILWSVGNEIHDIQANQPGSIKKLELMIGFLKKYDLSRPVTMVTDNTSGVRWRLFDYFDVHSWNYGRRYLPAREAEPTKSVIISESASTISTRGYYSFPLPSDKEDYLNKDYQISSYDMNAPWWAEPADQDYLWQEQDKYVAGEFVWTGFDYIGEPTPYNSTLVNEGKIKIEQAAKSSYFGIVDLCGIPKDRFYLYRSYWAPQKTTIHILPHWNWNGKEGENIPVFVYTNGDRAELFLNGKSLGMKEKNPKSENMFERYRLMWNDVKYEPGELKTVAYKEGKIIGEEIIRTAKSPSKIRLTTEKTAIDSEDDELAFILVEVLDEEGKFCPLAENEIEFTVEGAAKIAAVGNGNPQSLEPFISNKRKLFYGKAMLIISADGKGEQAIISANSTGLKSDSIRINIK
ncbi:MAG: DUF4982 domain-containing protein [Melioribacteraceae bacterium]|nr:DUF4982 domain-containing protein [Melioribacteraceae bacterium]MCF8265222.1 DUF4982 domain-containing protein [Melioribacteraceae bacterium]MCF8431291.1 DUF4982 domain-containing protein [Melioribacteraceae bacterium]